MKKIPLSSGDVFAIVDDEDYVWASRHKWYKSETSSGRIYAARRITRDKKRVVVYLHRAVWPYGDDKVLTFKNGDTLDCRKENLVSSERAMPTTTTEKGALGEAMVIADLARHGVAAFLPVSSHTPCDLIAYSPAGEVARIQVKYRTANRGLISLPLRNIHTNASGAIAKKMDLSMFDAFAIYCPQSDAVYYLTVDEMRAESVLNIRVGSRKSFQGTHTTQTTFGDACKDPGKLFGRKYGARQKSAA